MQQPETVGDLGEADLLRRILSRTDEAASSLIGPGDDAAVVRLAGGTVVATTDTLVDGPDFRRAWSSGFDLGWKAAAVNLADVAAMGARPIALLVALAMPQSTPVGDVEAIADGLREACRALAPGCAVVGGDLTASATLTIAVTALGDLDGRPAVTRGGAKPGDTVAVAGDLGGAGAGLALLFERFAENNIARAIDDDALNEAERAFLAAQLRPCPPIALGARAAAAGATAMMDVSDGLLLDARRMARASGVQIALDSAALGPDVRMALIGGEDHALLTTFSSTELPAGFRPIGRVLAGEPAVLVDGEAMTGRGGWDPYEDWSGAS